MDSNSKTADIDAPLHAIGFEIQEVSAHRLTGRFKVTPQCCQVEKDLKQVVLSNVDPMLVFLNFPKRNLIRWIWNMDNDQPFKFLHGGISALVAEALGSVGALIASGFKRVAGVQLSINHLSTAKLGDDVEAEAVPIKVGKTIQLWEVKLWKIDPTGAGKRVLISSSRVTVFCDLPMLEDATEALEKLKMHAKL